MLLPLRRGGALAGDGVPCRTVPLPFFSEPPAAVWPSLAAGEGERLELALPLEEGQPFPLEPLFCLGRLERVAGQLCVVYAFRGEEPGIW